MKAVPRAVWLGTGLAWAGRSLLEFAHPEYWNPVTTLDWLAVWSFSACLLLLAPSLVWLGAVTESRPVITVAVVVAIAAVAAGVANAVEDGLGIKALGTVYVLGAMTVAFGLLALAAVVYRAGYRRLAGVVVVLFVGGVAFVAGGGLLVLGTLGALAVTPMWFTLRAQAPEAAGTPAS